MSRKKTPNLMATLETGTSKPEDQKAGKPEGRKAGKPKRKKGQSRKPARQKASTPAPLLPKADTGHVERTKATYYLSTGAVDALETLWMQLRIEAGKDRSQVSRSALVELALQRLQDADPEELLEAILQGVYPPTP